MHCSTTDINLIVSGAQKTTQNRTDAMFIIKQQFYRKASFLH